MAGAVAAAVALGVAELVAGALVRVPSLVLAVGRAVVDLAPSAAVDTGIDTFGTADKPLLVVAILAVCVAAGASLGRAAARRPAAGPLGFAVFGAVGAWAALRVPEASRAGTLVTAALAVAAGWAALAALLRTSGVAAGRRPTGTADRRAFLQLGGALALAGVGAGVAGRFLRQRAAATVARARVLLPRPRSAAPPPAPGASFATPGLSPLVTPNGDFYRIDTALVPPQVDPAGWRLSFTGMVERSFSLGFDDLLALPMVERHVTLACVSNEVGGSLVGNARWLGVPLADLLERAGVRPGADQVVGRSVDGFTAGFPVEAALDGRDALVAVGMNGEPLPVAHGFPARLVVPGLYGYVSATKWLSEVELTTFDAYDAYWVPRGWARRAPVKTAARIDTPRRFAVPGRVAVAGVAWAPTRGISRVELRVDEGPWQEARLAEALSADTWRQWLYEWDAAPGTYLLEVRATDGAGEAQAAERRPPEPDGATGYHGVQVVVRPA